MIRPSVFIALTALSASVLAETSAPTNAPPAAPKTTSIQEMLVTGPSQLKMHSLAMISQGKTQGEIDESYLPGFKVCSEDPAIPVRSITAHLIGEHLIAGKDNPNPEAISLLMKLATDESADVRYNAIYHGLTQIKTKSPEMVEQLIEVAASNREQGLYERIIQSLENNKDQVIRILDAKLMDENSIAYYEIYEDFTGKKPENADKYLEMPSSRPRMFVFKGEGGDPSALKAELEKELVSVGIESPIVQISGAGENHVLMLKTYIIKDHQMVETLFSNHGKFKITQDLWLTPELEIQIEAMRKAQSESQ
jgi:hypothetical protein